MPKMAKILIDPGHSSERPGTQSKGGAVQEHEANAMQAEVVADCLSLAGHSPTIIDPRICALDEIGNAAHGFDLFLSLHHNAGAGGADRYTCVCVDSEIASEVSRELARTVARATARVIGNALLAPDGVYPRRLAVLRSAEIALLQSTRGPAILVESYFLDAYEHAQEIALRSLYAATGICEGLIKWLASRP